MNIELAKKVVAYIEAHPDEHDQGDFVTKDWDNACGTTACIAGHAMLLSGQYTIAMNEDHWPRLVEAKSHIRALMLADRAEDLLDITMYEREKLFFELQDNDEALAYLKELIDNAERAEK